MKQLWISACSDLQRLSRCQLRRKDDRRSFALPRASAGGGLHSRSEWNEGNGGKMWQLLSYSRDFAGCFQEREVNHFKRHVYPHNVVWLKKTIWMTLFPPCSLGENSIFCMSSHQTLRPRPSSDHASEKSILKEVEDMKVGHHGPPCQSRSKLRRSWSRPSQKGT